MGEAHRRGVESPRVHCTLSWPPFSSTVALPARPSSLRKEWGSEGGLSPAWLRSWAGRVRRQLNPGRKYGTCGPSALARLVTAPIPGRQLQDPARLPPTEPCLCEGPTTTTITGCPECLACGLPVEVNTFTKGPVLVSISQMRKLMPQTSYLARGHAVRNLSQDS